MITSSEWVYVDSDNILNQIPDQPTSIKSTNLRFYLYPGLKSQFKREVHAPCKRRRFGFSSFSERFWSKDRSKESSFGDMGNSAGRSKDSSKESSVGDMGNAVLRRKGKLTSVFDCVSEILLAPFRSYKEEELDVSDDCNRDVNGFLEERKDNLVIDVDSLVKKADVSDMGQSCGGSDGDTENFRRKCDGKGFERNFQPSSSALVPMLDELSLSRESDVQFLNLKSAIQLDEKILESHKKLWPQKKTEDIMKEVFAEAFSPLTTEERADVILSLRKSNRKKVLVTHEKSCIDITGEKLQCLKPREWLNDEVINVYLGLLKERETREPQKFLKCHFFNTFFYKKLISGDGGYNFQSVRRWTSEKKLGYCLLDCDKIFVPIHQEVHWCLAIINNRDKKFQYLDSFKGVDHQVMAVLMRYYADEIKDKTGIDFNLSSWRQEFVKDLPEQKNGFDCGMFMIKYVDFYSRGLGLCFDQRQMQYFRNRTIMEILRLKAE